VRTHARFVCALGAAISGSVAMAQAGGGYDLHWNARTAGGGRSSGAGYTVTASIGQPATSACINGISGKTLRSGFWGGITEGDVIFRNGFDPGC
jgi:hypothetical protein